MNDLNQIFFSIEVLLGNTLNYLNKVNIDDFDENFSLAIENIEKAHNLRATVTSENLPKEFDIKKKKINFLAKQIEEKYDSMLENYKNNVSEVSGELKKIGNKRKLILYSGGK